jgi:integration host factor subunit alpha|tara:strand:- start:373 stop:672 length:300 start_codon:yes stop_codon:yes gene_type:complete
MISNITRDDIAEYINQEFGLTKKDCNDFVNEIIEEIILGLQKNNIVKIHNFGTFKIKSKKSRLGRNPKTKEEVVISARKVVSFIPSKHILKKLNLNFDE